MRAADADKLVAEVMRERGYPVEDFDQQADDVSVDHPEVVEHYRKAHAIQSAREASTEELRQAMVHYRALFDELLETDRDPARESRRSMTMETKRRATRELAGDASARRAARALRARRRARVGDASVPERTGRSERERDDDATRR